MDFAVVEALIGQPWCCKNRYHHDRYYTTDPVAALEWLRMNSGLPEEVLGAVETTITLVLAGELDLHQTFLRLDS